MVIQSKYSIPTPADDPRGGSRGVNGMDGRGGGSSISLCVDDLIRNKDGEDEMDFLRGGRDVSISCYF